MMEEKEKPAVQPTGTMEGNDGIPAANKSAGGQDYGWGAYLDEESTPKPTAVFEPTGGQQPARQDGDATMTSVATGGKNGAPRIAATVPGQYTGSSNDELIRYLEQKKREVKPLTDGQLKKLRRRQKAEAAISGISDAVRSVANLVFTTKYAPDMYDHKSSLSARAKERFEREAADRKAKDDEYFNYAMTIGKLKDAEEQKQYQRGRDALQDNIRKSQEDRAQAKDERDAAMAKLQMDLMAGKINTQDAEARIRGIEADYAKSQQEADLALKKARERSANASAANSRASAAAHGQKVHHFMGKEYASDKDYTKVVSEAARQYNERHLKRDENGKIIYDDTNGKEPVYEDGFTPVITEYVEKKGFGPYAISHRIPRNVAEYAGELETRIAAEEMDNTPPSRRRTNDNNPPDRR